MKNLNNLETYIGHFHKVMPDNICDKALDELQTADFEQHRFYNDKTKELVNISGNDELDISHTDILSKKIITNRLHAIIGSYIHNLKLPWFKGWNAYSPVRFNKYSKNKKMALHIDHIHSLFDGKLKGVPVLSILGTLNEDYEGGEFILLEDYKINFKKGDVVIFPSNFLYPHKVEPVTKGTRYSYISWAW